MDIYDYLKKDHRKVAKLFKSIISSSASKEREKLFFDLKNELELHADPEHDTFYEALKVNSAEEKEIEHADEEHSEIKKALRKLSSISPKETVKWLVQLGELKRIVEHHVHEEETEIFKHAKNIISNTEAEELAIKMEELKQKRMQSKSFQNQSKGAKNKKSKKAAKRRAK